MFWLEQWKWALCSAAAWAAVSFKDKAAPQLHGMQFTRPSLSKLSEQWQEGLAAHGDEGESRRARSPGREKGKKDPNLKPKKEEDDSSYTFSDIDPGHPDEDF